MKTDQAAASVVVGIAAGAFALSYEALRFVYLGSTGHDRLSVIYPLIVEGFVTVAVWTAYRLRDWGWKATAYPWTLAALFFAYSLWANSRPETVPAPVVRGIPSLAVPLAVHLFTHMTKRRASLGVELVAHDTEMTPEALSEDAWPEWELPALDGPEKAAEGIFSDDAETGTMSIFTEPKQVVSTTVAPSGDGARIRTWARSHGYTVKDTGRIPLNILEAFAKAHGGELVGV